MYLRDKFLKRQLFWSVCTLSLSFFSSADLDAASFYYDFLWSDQDNQYLIDEELSPELILYENNNYIFTKKTGFDSNLTLVDRNDSNKTPLVLEEIFNNSLTTRSDYIHFTPNSSTPRELFYTNYASSDTSETTGRILVREKTSLEFTLPGSLQVGAMFGSNIVFDDSLNLFVSAPGLDGTNGEVYFFEKGFTSYSFHNSVSVPNSERTQFGGSLLPSLGKLFIGAPDKDSFKGAVYAYDLNDSGFVSSSHSQLIVDPLGDSGDLFGWDMAVFDEQIVVSAPYAGASNSGHVVLFSTAGNNTLVHGDTILSSSSKSGDEFGYDIEFVDNFLFVGAPGHDIADEINSGAVYIFQKNDGNWNETKITAPDFSSGDRFGHSLAFENNLLFVGSEFGDGLDVDCGSVYIFERVDVDWVFRKKLFPSKSGTNQLFSSQLQVDGHLLCVTSSGPDSDGDSSVYIFRMDESTHEWEEVSTIDLNFFEDQEKTKTSLIFKQGTVVIGNPNHNQQTGGVAGFYNPSWQSNDIPSLNPIIPKSAPSILSTLEDSGSLSYNFDFEHPFEVEVEWSILEHNASSYSFDLNVTTGEFIYIPETDFNGLHSFKIKASAGDSSSSHFFQVRVDPVDDPPYFIHVGDSKLVVEDGVGFEGFSFPVFDPDGDPLSVSLVSGGLPEGMSITNNTLIGTPNEENENDSNYSFTVGLSDDGEIFDTNHTYNLVLLPQNEAPRVTYLGDENSTVFITLDEDFSTTDWSNIINNFNISDDNNFTVSLLEEPNFGEVIISQSQNFSYIPPPNFSGVDTFKIRFLDNHFSNPKFTDLSLRLIIDEINDPPTLVSNLPPSTAVEKESFEYEFEFFDPDLGDTINLSVHDLPSWLVFDGNRTISGIPSRTDFLPDVVHSVKFKAVDQRGAHFSGSFNLEVIPLNYPPVIEGASTVSFEISEDSTAYWSFELNATDLEDDELSWEIKVFPQNGSLDLSFSEEKEMAEIHFLPDANFTGVDEFVVSVFNVNDPDAEDSVSFTANITNISDPPVFLSQPYTVVLRGTPWDYKIQVFDPDPSANLTVEVVSELPDWIDFDHSLNLLSGFPPESSVTDFPITLKVDDNDSDTLQSFTLTIVDSIEPITIFEPQIGEQSILEDSSWLAGNLTIENVQGRKITWSIIEEPLNGTVSFLESHNGEIENLTYLPNTNFWGNDSFVIQASDGFSSDFRNFNFSVAEVPDPPIIVSTDPGNVLNIEDHEDLNITILFSDGDGLGTLSYEVLEIPSWVSADLLDFGNGLIKFRGVPGVVNVGLHLIRLKLFGLDDLLETEVVIEISVDELNKPANLLMEGEDGLVRVDSLNLWMDEDDPLTWNPPNLFAEDNETDAELLHWTIEEIASNGHASIDSDGANFTYMPDANFSGTDLFILGITDGGVIDKNSSPKTTRIPVYVDVRNSNDQPIILSVPVTEWTDEFLYEYRLNIFDSDWPWQGYPEITLESKLPNWALWQDDGNGSGLLSGKPAFWDEGQFFFSFKINSGVDQLSHQFYLDINVEDFPPLVTKMGETQRVDKLQLSFDEDNFDEETWRLATSFQASDPENAQSVNWSIHQNPTSGADLNISTDGNQLKRIHYYPPQHFNGTDRFVLKASEGEDDRFSLLPIEVIFKPISDPPFFPDDVLPPNVLTANPGDHFEVFFQAIDHDGDKLNFKTFFSGSHIPSWFQKLDEDPEEGTILLGGNAPLSVNADSNFSFTLVVSDSTGRFSSTQHTVIYENVNFPPVIQEGDKFEIVFDENISTKNFPIFPLKAIDANNDLLMWSVSRYHQPRYGELFLVQDQGLLKELKYVPSNILPARDSFTLEVSDGIASDSVVVNAFFDHAKFVVKLPDRYPDLYEGQFFNFHFFVQDEPLIEEGYTVTLMKGPSWVSVNKLDGTNFEISGEVPEIAIGTHLISLKVTHPNGYDAQFLTTEFVVKDKDKSSLKLLGSSEIFLPIEKGFEDFSDPGFFATNNSGNEDSNEVNVTYPSILEVGKNVISYQYNEYSLERIVWGVDKSPFSGIASQISLAENSLIALGGTPLSDYLVETNGDIFHSAAGTFFDGFSISKIDRNDFTKEKLSFFTSSIRCSEINDFQYSESYLYVLGMSLEDEINSIFLNKIDLEGNSVWQAKFPFNGEVENLQVLPSSSGNLLVYGSLNGSIDFNSKEIINANSQTFALLIDSYGKLNNFSVLGQSTGSLSMDYNNVLDTWYIAHDQIDEFSSHFTKVQCFDRFLNLSYEIKIDDLYSPQISCSHEHIYLLGQTKMSPSSNQELLLLKLDAYGTKIWEKKIAQNSHLDHLKVIDLDYNTFGHVSFSLSFSESCNVLGTNYPSRGGIDSLVVSLSHNNGELLWVEQIGDLGNDIIINQFSNDGGIYGIEVSSDATFSFHDDQVLSSYVSNDSFINFESHSQSPEIFQSDVLEFVIDEPNLYQLEIINQLFFGRAKIHGMKNWLEVIYEGEKIHLSAYPKLSEWLDFKDVDQTFTLSIFGENNSYTEYLIPFKFVLPERLNSSQSIIPPVDSVKNIFGNADIVGTEGNATFSFVLGNFKGDLKFDKSSHYSSSRSSSFIYCVENKDLSLAWDYIIYSDEFCSIVDLAMDKTGNLYAVGNFSGKIQLSNRSLTASSGTDYFIVMISPSGAIDQFTSFPGVNDQSISSLTIGDKAIYVCGSFSGDFVVGGNEIKSFGKTDGFIAKHNLDELSKMEWAVSVGGYGYDYCKDIDLADGSLAVIGDFTSSINLGDNYVTLDKNYMGSFLGELSKDGVLLNHYVFNSSGSLNSEKVAYDDSAKSFFVFGEFFDEMSSEDSFLASSYDEVFVAKVDRSLNRAKLHKFRGNGDKSFSDAFMSERGYFYIVGGFSSNIELSGKTFSSSGKNDAFLSKLNTSSLSEVDYFLLQSDQLDQIHTVSNHSRNEILLSGRSHSSILTSSDIYSNNDHTLISLRFPMDSVVGAKFTDFHPVGVGQPFKFDFITFGVDEGKDFFEIDKIDLPSWASVKMVDSNNGYLFGNAPDEEGNFPIKLNFKLTDLEAVTLQENLVVKNGKPTPSILIPRSLQLEQFTTFEIPFLVENTNGERVRFSSDFPTWFEIVSTNTNEFMLRGIPDESSVGTYVFKLSASTPAGLTDKSEISVTVNKNNSTLPLINDGELNTWSESWIGPVYLLESGWGYHAYLGWIYIQTNQFSGTWTWSEKWNWLWTSDQYWDGLEGNFFSKNLNQWIFVKVDQKKKRNLIYNYQSEKWYPY